MTKFADFNLHKDLMKSLEKMGFDTPTDIQAELVPLALKGQDVMASAQTGSGKTAAFLLPAFQRLLEKPDESKAARRKRGPRVLILTPTRELADQVMKVATELRSFTDLTAKSVVGGIPIFKHLKAMEGIVDVLVATPGRLIDLMKRKAVDLSSVETFVLDEADRMLDMGFSTDVLTISQAVGTKRQTMLLSATLEGNIASVVKQVMDNPQKIELTHSTQRHENITQCAYRANDAAHKNELLAELLKDNAIWQAVIFVATKRMVEKMAKRLSEAGHKVDFLHGDMRQSARNKAMKRMQAGHVRLLVATDVAARGLDIKELTHVINFDMPRNSEDYIHRIGRVGRAGKAGDAISLVSHEQWGELMSVERLIGHGIEQKEIEGMEPTRGAPSGKKKPKRKEGLKVRSGGRFQRFKRDDSSGNKRPFKKAEANGNRFVKSDDKREVNGNRMKESRGKPQNKRFKTRKDSDWAGGDRPQRKFNGGNGGNRFSKGGDNNSGQNAGGFKKRTGAPSSGKPSFSKGAGNGRGGKPFNRSGGSKPSFRSRSA